MKASVPQGAVIARDSLTRRERRASDASRTGLTQKRRPVGGVGAGDGIRTRDVNLGKPSRRLATIHEIQSSSTLTVPGRCVLSRGSSAKVELEVEPPRDVLADSFICAGTAPHRIITRQRPRLQA